MENNKLFFIDNNIQVRSFTFNNDEMYLEIQLDIDKTHFCKRCGRPIVDIESVQNEMGPTCYHIYLHECNKKSRKLF